MSDHNKLKLAFDIAAKYSTEHGIHAGVSWLHDGGVDTYKLSIPMEYRFDNLDELIEKLTEMTRSQENCQHEYKKTLSKSGMHFISMCHKCDNEKQWVECQHESDGVVYYSNPGQCRCVKCEEFYK